VAIAATIHDVLYVDSLVQSRSLLPLGLQAFVLAQSFYLASRYARSFSVSQALSEQMRSLLGFTRELNRSGERESAIWTAVQEIQKCLPIAPDASAAYVLDRDRIQLQRVTPGRAPEVTAHHIRFPVRVGDRCLAVLEAGAADQDLTRAWALAERPYIEGVLDSL